VSKPFVASILLRSYFHISCFFYCHVYTLHIDGEIWAFGSSARYTVGLMNIRSAYYLHTHKRAQCVRRIE
jgi:hypothetical protein